MTSTFSSYFQNNSGTVTINATLSSFTTSSTFYNLEFYSLLSATSSINQSPTIATGTTLTIQNDLMMSTYGTYIQFLGGGQINVQGNIDGGYAALVATSTASLALTGTSTQIIDTSNGYSFHGTNLVLPGFTIQK